MLVLDFCRPEIINQSDSTGGFFFLFVDVFQLFSFFAASLYFKHVNVNVSIVMSGKLVRTDRVLIIQVIKIGGSVQVKYQVINKHHEQWQTRASHRN